MKILKKTFLFFIFFVMSLYAESVLKDKKLVVGVMTSKESFFVSDAQKEFTANDVELAKKIAVQVGYADITLKKVSDDFVKLLSNNSVDIVILPKYVDFVDYQAQLDPKLDKVLISVLNALNTGLSEDKINIAFLPDSYSVIKQRDNNDIVKKRDINKRKVGFIYGTSDEIKDKITTAIETREYDNFYKATEGLRLNEVDVIISDDKTALLNAKEYYKTLVLVNNKVEKRDFAIAIKNENTELLKNVKTGYSILKELGMLKTTTK